MRFILIAVGFLLAYGSASASPLTNSIAKDLADKSTRTQADLSKEDYCGARHETDDAIAGLEMAMDETASSQPVDMPTVKSIHVVASPDDVLWINDRINKLQALQGSLGLFCPPTQ
jgi:hypothetical protein